MIRIRKASGAIFKRLYRDGRMVSITLGLTSVLGFLHHVVQGPTPQTNPMSVVIAAGLPSASTPAEHAKDDVGERNLAHLYRLLVQFRQTHSRYPTNMTELMTDIYRSLGRYGFRRPAEVDALLRNPDAAKADDPEIRAMAPRVIPYVVRGLRIDGTPCGSTPRPPYSRDVLAYTDIYFHANRTKLPDGETLSNPTGYYLVLWDDGAVERVPYDEVSWVRVKGNTYHLAFPDEAGVQGDCIRYDEMHFDVMHSHFPAVGKPTPPGLTTPLPDDGAAEAVLFLGRCLGKGLTRDVLWRVFSPEEQRVAPETFRLCAEGLGIHLAERDVSRSNLPLLQVPFIVALNGPAAYEVVVAITSEWTLVYHASTPHLVKTTELRRRYAGRVWVPTGISSAKEVPRVENALGEIPVRGPTAVVPVVVRIVNPTGHDLKLHPELPACGCRLPTGDYVTVHPHASARMMIQMAVDGRFARSSYRLVVLTLVSNMPDIPRLFVARRLVLRL